MNKLFKFTLIILLIGFLFFSFREKIEGRFGVILRNVQSIYDPCGAPITYSLGSFDQRFGVSKDDFLSALKESENMWEKEINKDLFLYVPSDGRLKINLIYDYRQEATSKLKSLGMSVDENKATYDELNAKYTELNALYKEAKLNYDNRLSLFNKRVEAYDAQVTFWNSKGGAPKKDYEKLQAERVIIETEIKELENLKNIVNEYVSNIRSLVVVINSIANELNIDVRKYNDIGSSLGEEFEEGVYRNDGMGKEEIDIYEFNSRNKLIRVLAHELGHALSLPHVEDKLAIMYKLNISKNQTLSLADINELKTRCRIK